MATRLAGLGGLLARGLARLLLRPWRRREAALGAKPQCVASHGCEVTTTYLVDNFLLEARAQGLSYRLSKQLCDLDSGEDKCAPWGTSVVGVDQGDGWLRVGDRYLPMWLRGVQVLLLTEVSHQCPASLAVKSGMPRSVSSCSTSLGAGEEDAQGQNGPCESASESEGEHEEEEEEEEADANSNSLWAGAHRIGKAAGCEDAFFVAPFALGVADGVGSVAKFARHGVDAAAYAAELMEIAERTLRPAAGASRAAAPGVDAVAAMAAAEREAMGYGASTVTIVQLRGDRINVASLGDSGFMLLRAKHDGFEIACRSKEQQHDWNFPFQLERFPPVLMRQVVPGHCPDSAEDCARLDLEVVPGDLLLLFTDGFSDNLYDHEVVSVVERLAGASPTLASPSAIAQELARAAHRKSVDESARVPFGENALMHGYHHFGGKPDDITVAAAWVTSPARHGQVVGA